jgi:hypothetical protein
MHGRRWVRSITAPSNELSIAFHRGVGFEPLHGDILVNGLPVWLDYAGAGGHRVVFRRAVIQEGATALPGREHQEAGALRDGLDEILAS